MKQKIKKVWAKRPRRKQNPERSLEQAIKGIPRITNETVAEHREEVLGSARKYIYPLQHSAHRVVSISVVLVVVGIVAFFTYCFLALYKFNSSSTFLYRVTQVIPFPIAKAGPDFVAYENYLFELRHYMHYYETQQKVDFTSTSGQQQLDSFRQRALDSVISNAYVKQLAKENGVSVSDQEVNDQIAIVQSQNRLGNDPKVFENVLKEFWGWSLDDFKRVLKQQILAQKVVSKLDTATHERAEAASQQLATGAPFADVARAVSEDKNTASNGGDYGFAITRTNRDIPAQVVNELFKLQPGQTSGIINTGNTLEIVKLNERNGDEVKASHISFTFKNIDEYIKKLRDQKKPNQYITP